MLSTAVSHAVIVRAGLVKVFVKSPHTKKDRHACQCRMERWPYIRLDFELQRLYLMI